MKSPSVPITKKWTLPPSFGTMVMIWNGNPRTDRLLVNWLPFLVHKCEQKLRCSRTYRVMNGNLEADESRRPIRSRSRSLSRTSISNSTSISNISKFFTRSRSQPPFSSSTISSAVSSSPDLVLRPSKSTPSNQHPPEVNRRNSWKQRSRSQSISGDPLTPSSEDNLKTPAPQRRKLSFDASFFKIDLKPSSTPPLSTKQRQHSLSKPQQLISSHKNTKKSVAPIDAPSALARQNASPTHTMKLQASNPKGNPIPYQSWCNIKSSFFFFLSLHFYCQIIHRTASVRLLTQWLSIHKNRDNWPINLTQCTMTWRVSVYQVEKTINSNSNRNHVIPSILCWQHALVGPIPCHQLLPTHQHYILLLNGSQAFMVATLTLPPLSLPASSTLSHRVPAKALWAHLAWKKQKILAR